MQQKKASSTPAAKAPAAKTATASDAPSNALVATDTPAFLAQAVASDPSLSGSGLEHMRQQDIVFPRLRIAQPTSPVVTENGVKMGSFYNTADKSVVVDADQIAEFMVAFWSLSWIEWADKDAGDDEPKGIINIDTNPHGELAGRCARREKKMFKKGEGLAVTEYYNLFVVMRHQPDALYLLPCFRTGHKHGRELLNMMRQRKINGAPAPIFSGVYTVETALKVGDKGRWFEPKFGNAGFVTPAEFERLRTLHNELKSQHEARQIDYREPDDEPEAVEAHSGPAI